MHKVPRHEITVSPVVARKLELAYTREALGAGGWGVIMKPKYLVAAG